MKTNVVISAPAFTLWSLDYNGSAKLDVTFDDLKRFPVGHIISVSRYNSCGRGVDEETLQIVYRDERGASCLLRHFGTTDEPNPEEWEKDPELIWFEF
jgi:hypothetical protein